MAPDALGGRGLGLVLHEDVLDYCVGDQDLHGLAELVWGEPGQLANGHQGGQVTLVVKADVLADALKMIKNLHCVSIRHVLTVV